MIKLLRFMKPYRLILIVVVLLAFGQAMSNLYLPTLMGEIVDYGIVKQDTGYIWRTGGIMSLVTLGGVLFWQNYPGQAFYARATIFAARVRHDGLVLADYPHHQRYNAGAAGHDHYAEYDDHGP